MRVGCGTGEITRSGDSLVCELAGNDSWEQGRIRSWKGHMGPVVSVLMAVYNGGDFLQPAVRSILSQTYRNLELWIIDDGSTDGAVEAIKRESDDPRVRFIKQSRSGKSVALNRAIKEIRGEFYAIQDADDLSHPKRIERQLHVLNDYPELAGVFTGYDLILNGKRVAPRFREKGIEECRLDINAMRMPSHDPTVMYRVSRVREIHFDPALSIGQGWDHILRVGERDPLMVLGECLYSYRCNPNSNTRSDSDRRRGMRELVLRRACARRGLVLDGYRAEKALKNRRHREREHGIVSHFMESVLDQKVAGRFGGAFRTAVECLNLHPLDTIYYKPLAYAVTPVSVVTSYRNLRGKW